MGPRKGGEDESKTWSKILNRNEECVGYTKITEEIFAILARSI